jgi:hypothetical protein
LKVPDDEKPREEAPGADEVARETAVKLMIGCDIYSALTLHLFDPGRTVAPGEWEARYLKRMRDPTLGFPVEEAIIAAAERIFERLKGQG